MENMTIEHDQAKDKVTIKFNNSKITISLDEYYKICEGIRREYYLQEEKNINQAIDYNEFALKKVYNMFFKKEIQEKF